MRGLEGAERDILLTSWIELWRGAVSSHRVFMDVDVVRTGEQLVWTISACQASPGEKTNMAMKGTGFRKRDSENEK